MVPARELHDPGRYLVLWLAPILLWYFNRDSATSTTMEEVVCEARFRPSERQHFAEVNSTRMFAWIIVMLAPFAFVVPTTLIRWDDLDSPNPILNFVFRSCVLVGLFGAFMALPSGLRWSLAMFCDALLSRHGGQVRARPVSLRRRICAWFLRRCIPGWGDLLFAIPAALFCWVQMG